MLATLLACDDPCDPWALVWPDPEILGEAVMEGALRALMGNPRPKPTGRTIWDLNEPVQFRMNLYELNAFQPQRMVILAGF